MGRGCGAQSGVGRIRSRRRRGPLTTIATAAAVLVVAACAGSPAATSDPRSAGSTAPPPAAGTTTPVPWDDVDQALRELAPQVGFLAARVTPQGTCEAVHEIAPGTPRPTGSQFKLYVLGALADQITAGRASWDQTLTVEDRAKSAGNGEGSLQAAAPGTTVSVEDAATKMISISDNTATDMLIGLVGRDAVQAKNDAWSESADANVPFLTTREVLLLHYVPGLADAYLATAPDERVGFLKASVDPRPVTDIGLGLSADPRHIDRIEWFASPDDICRAFAGLQQLARAPGLAPLTNVLSRETGTIGLDATRWPTVWFKGGSEPGVLTLGWLATNDRGDTFVVQAMISNPDAALGSDSITRLVGISRKAFERLR